MPKSIDDFYKGSMSGELDFSNLGLTDEGLVDVSDFIDKEALQRETFQVSLPFLEEYHGMETFIIKNIEINTIIRDDMVETGFNTQDAIELEDYRMFPRGFMQKHGVFYCSNLAEMIPHYELFKHTDIFQITNDTYEDRYMLPICLPNGHVFTHMGYCPPIVDSSAFKYIMGNVPWIDQGNLIGHLESLKMYPDKKTIYVCEGMMDAYRLSDLFQAPSLAILGARLTMTKRAILSMLVEQGYILIYVPDMDSTGMNQRLISDKLFSNLIQIDKSTKDIDQMVKTRYIDYIKENYESLNTDIEVNKVPAALIPTEERLKIHEEIKSSLKYMYQGNLYPKSSATIFNQLMRGFSLKNVV